MNINKQTNTHTHTHTHTLREKGSVDAENVEEDKVHRWSSRSENGEMLSVSISESNKYTNTSKEIREVFWNYFNANSRVPWQQKNLHNYL